MKPAGQTTTASTPSAGKPRMTSRMSGPIHGSGVRPALCQAMRHRATPARAATASAVSRNWSGYGSPVVEDAGREAVGGEERLDHGVGRGAARADDAVGQQVDEPGLEVPALDD